MRFEISRSTGYTVGWNKLKKIIKLCAICSSSLWIEAERTVSFLFISCKQICKHNIFLEIFAHYLLGSVMLNDA